MPHFTHDPPTAPRAGFIQTIRMLENDRSIGLARWHAADDSPDGVIQILDFNIEPAYRRQGHGKRLMAALVDECLAYSRARRQPLRRLWLTVRQKKQVIARAFMLSQGFSHIATIRDLLEGEDALVCIRTFD